MSDGNELDNSAGLFSSRPSPRSFDMPGGAVALPSSDVVVRCLWFRSFSCGCCLALSCLLPASCADASPPVPPSCLLAIRSARFALSSYRSAPRSFDKWGGAVCVSVLVCPGGRCRLLLAVLVAWMWLGGFSRGSCSSPAVSMVSAGGVISVVPVACRIILSGWSVSLVPVPSSLLA